MPVRLAGIEALCHLEAEDPEQSYIKITRLPFAFGRNPIEDDTPTPISKNAHGERRIHYLREDVSAPIVVIRSRKKNDLAPEEKKVLQGKGD
ncbi:MAG: hypothetical protein OXG37_15070 [Actinomycetia bacterium]|nr:hypothetical protein [Actinomycetes bacterium]